MNKTFNDPNTRYSDQGTPLAQAADAFNAVADLTETVDDLGVIVEELEEVIDQIPAPTVDADGKFLGVTLDESGETPVAQYELVDAPDPLPTIASGDAGKVLTVNSGETGAEWSAPSGGAPLSGTFIITPPDRTLLSLAQGSVNFYRQTSDTGGTQHCNDSRCVIFANPIIIKTEGGRTYIGYVEKSDAGGYKSFSISVTWYRAFAPDPSIESIGASGGSTYKWYDLS